VSQEMASKRPREESEDSAESDDEFKDLNIESDSDEVLSGSVSSEEDSDNARLVDEEGNVKETAPFYPDLFHDSEDSENERELLTIGNVPLSWYEDFDHVGYDLEGKQIAKPKSEGEIDRLIAQDDNPWSVFNEKLGRRENISQRDLETIQRIKSGKEDDRYSWENCFVELNEHTDPIHPVSNKPEPKSRFLPSKWEARRIRRLTYY